MKKIKILTIVLVLLASLSVSAGSTVQPELSAVSCGIEMSNSNIFDGHNIMGSPKQLFGYAKEIRNHKDCIDGAREASFYMTHDGKPWDRVKYTYREFVQNEDGYLIGDQILEIKGQIKRFVKPIPKEKIQRTMIGEYTILVD